MKHLTYEFDAGRLVWILFFEMHDEAEGTVFEGSICRADNDSVPLFGVLISLCFENARKCGGLPGHDIVRNGRCGNAGRGIGLHAL